MLLLIFKTPFVFCSVFHFFSFLFFFCVVEMRMRKKVGCVGLAEVD